jgi:transglutaminase-like putative cysteine protease
MNRVFLGQVFALLLFSLSLPAQKAGLSSSKAPDWVTLRPLPAGNKALDGDAENGVVDLCYEKQVNLAAGTTYIRSAQRILSEAGVQNNSDISVDFDPSYERLIFHSVQVHREGKVFNQLDLARFKTIQKEADLDQFQYNGTRTAHLLLDDIRKGDVVEYSYSVKGANPVFKGRYADAFTTRFSVPVYQLFYKLMVPAGRVIQVDDEPAGIKAIKEQTPGGTTYVWVADNIPAMRMQNGTPSWYDAYSSVAVSEFKSWKEVSNWALGLFPDVTNLSPDLKKKISTIQSAGGTAEEQVLQALHFVQDDVRYFGIEIGENTYRPNHPNKIFSQRFGDCKDKSYLLITMLRALGLEAYPVLINTEYKKSINTWLPSSFAFNHCTVQVVVQGKKYWLDPTLTYQRGNLEAIYYPDYQYGLVVTPATSALTPIETNKNNRVTIHEELNIPDFSGEGQLIVHTTYKGSAADDVRSDFNRNSLYEMKEKYREFYAGYFDDITVDSLAWKDETDGSFTTWEYYTLEEVWKKVQENKELYLSPYVIRSLFLKPGEAKRNMPFALTYPLDYTEDIDVRLPEDWDIDSDDTKVDGNYFWFRSAYSNEGNTVHLHYEYKNRKDHVAAEETKAYLADYAAVNEASGYRLYWDDKLSRLYTGSTGKNPFSLEKVYQGLYVAVGLLVLLTYIFRRKKTREY